MALPSGLELIHDFITREDELNILQLIDSGVWDVSLRRRVQQYGHKYNYQHSRVDPISLGPPPEWLTVLAQRLYDSKMMEFPDQFIVNEYLPGQGISAHTDNKYAFGPVVVSISLAWEVPMLFQLDKTIIEVLLPRRSALVLKDDARTKWTHCIEPRKKDSGITRVRRVSVTFRTIRRN